MRTDQEYIKLTAKHQVTIPRHVRQKLGLKSGDVVRFRIKGDEVVVEKPMRSDPAYLKMLDATLTEWHSPEDDALFKDL